MSDAASLLRELAGRYAGLTSYRDRGVVRREDGTVLLAFRTAFQRPDEFCFEFLKAGERTIVRQSGPWSTFESSDGCEEMQELMDAVAAATGLSLGAAHTTSALLLPEAAGSDWTVARLEDAAVTRPPDGASSAWHWLEGRGWAGQRLRVAVDRGTGLLRRIDDAGQGRVRPTITEYVPEANPLLAPEDFSLPLIGAREG